MRIAGLIAVLIFLAGCDRELQRAPVVAGGDAGRGRQAAQDLDCGACHVIPGVRGARGGAAVPLEAFARRIYIAGRWPNQPPELVRFLVDPPSAGGHTLMPSLTRDESVARDLAAFLYTLQ